MAPAKRERDAWKRELYKNADAILQREHDLLHRAEQAEADLAALREQLQYVIDASTPVPPGGQHVGPPKFSMTISTRKELQRMLADQPEHIHADCHDLVCSGDRKKPRGAKGVSCSCRMNEYGPAWRPIETAPKDGGMIVVCDNYMNLAKTYWHHGVGGWSVPGEVRYLRFTPTHWLPLPAPPSEAR